MEVATEVDGDPGARTDMLEGVSAAPCRRRRRGCRRGGTAAARHRRAQQPAGRAGARPRPQGARPPRRRSPRRVGDGGSESKSVTRPILRPMPAARAPAHRLWAISIERLSRITITFTYHLMEERPPAAARRARSHRVVGRCVMAGRTLGTADVEISTWDEPDRLVAVGRARFIRGAAS